MTAQSFPSILTSTHALMYDGYRTVDENRSPAASVLSEGGYATGGFHSNPHLYAKFGYDNGFDTFYDSNSDSSFLDRFRPLEAKFDPNGYPYEVIIGLVRAVNKSGIVSFNDRMYTPANELTDMAISWYEDQSNPRFLWIHYMDVHHPYAPPEEFQLKFRNEPISSNRANRVREKMLEEPRQLTADEQQLIQDLYDAETAYVDNEVRRLYDSVDDDAIFALTADHGEEFLEHGQVGHNQTFYDELLSVPLILNVGDRPDAHDEIVGLLDLAPTILDYADMNVPESYLGNSLRPLVESDDWDRSAVIAGHDNSRGGVSHAYRDRSWKYITHSNAPDELYDIQQDPGEQSNIAEANSSVVQTIRDSMAEYLDRVNEDVRDLSPDVNEETEQRLKDLGYR